MDQFSGQRGAEVGRGQVDYGVHFSDQIRDGLRCNHDPGADAGQAQLGETHAINDIFIPDGAGLGKDDIRKRRAIGVINDQGDVIGPGQFDQPGQLGIGQHIAGRIGGPGHAHCGGVIRHGQIGKIHMIFEEMIVQPFNQRAVGIKQAITQAEIGIADIFRRDRQQDLPLAARVIRAAQQVEQIKKGGLTADRQDHILGLQAPLILPIHQFGQRLDKFGIAAWRFIIAEGMREPGRVVQQALQGHFEMSLDGRDMGRITAAQHQGIGIAGQRLAEIIH